VLSAGYYDAYYAKAQAMRARIAADFQKVFDSGVDFLFTPSTPSPAFRAGEKTEDPVAMYLADVFTCPVSLAGLPGVSIPVGRTNGLPLGGQIIAPYFEDEAMLSIASTIEAHLDATGEVQ
jgi:aspartyl-tRNA(Asn)/glutamyl-tRNA(Gln) amidotransferase subunit A